MHATDTTLASWLRKPQALEQAKRQLTKAQKGQHAAEMAAAEARGKAEAEREAGRLEAALVQQQLDTAKR